MKIEPVTTTPVAHPLSPLAEWLRSAKVGDSVRVSDLPDPYFAASLPHLNQGIAEALEIEDQAALPYTVERADTLLTPKYYLVTKTANA